MARQTSDIGPAAQTVVERLALVAQARPLERSQVESALAAHLRALDVAARPVRWIEKGDHLASAREGFSTAWADLWKTNKGKPLVVGMTSTATFRSLYGGGLRKGGLVGAAEKQEKAAGSGTRREAQKAAKSVNKRLEDWVNQASRHRDLTNAARDALHEKGIHERTTMAQAIGSTPELQRARQEGELNQEISKGDAARQAATAAEWLARAHVLKSAGKSVEALERVARVYLPLVDAVEAGLWLFWVTENDVIAVAVPAEG